MDMKTICSNSEACLHFINSKFEFYKERLDYDQQTSDQLITSIREQIARTSNHESILQQLDYFEEESFKTYEENKTCLFKMFQNLFHLHREFAYDEVIIQEQRIAELFQYRPSLLSNIEKLRTTLPVVQSTISNSKSFSNRADINAFKQKTETTPPKIPSSIASNEIDLTKFIRDTQPISKSTQFNFSQITQNSQSTMKSFVPTLTTKKSLRRTIPCDDALLSAANKRFVLLYNINHAELLHIFDMQSNQTKEYQWDEGVIHSLGHVESNLFYLITSTKIFLYDIIKESINKQEFLYDTLYKNLFLLADDLAYRTALKPHNQIQSTVFDDYCYYLYTNKDYHQILIKSSLDNFQTDLTCNLSLKYPHVAFFLGFTVIQQSLVTLLVLDSNGYQLFFCNELNDFNLNRTISINHAVDARQILSTFLPNFPNVPLSNYRKAKVMKSGRQLWFVLDVRLNCVHCLTEENYLKNIRPTQLTSIQSISIFEEKLVLASNEFTVEIIDLDEYISSGKF